MAMGAIPGVRRLIQLSKWVNQLLGGHSNRFRPLFDATRLSALRGRLEVVRDRNGVAHLYAEQEPDLYVALGYLQATERLVHLDFLRQLGRGTLTAWIANVRVPASSELFPGVSIADIDRFVRPLSFAEEAARDLPKMNLRAQVCLEAFAQGVNDALKAGHLPPEHLFLAAPSPWTPEDCLVAARASALVIALLPLENELVFDTVRAEDGDVMARLLYPDAPWQQAPEVSAGGQESLPSGPIDPLTLGSNNWAVAGTRTASGKPLFANDPHVPLVPAPTFWHHVHLHCNDYDVQGGMYPGFPAFGFGHNAYFAWGVTTAFRDAWDLFRIERVDSEGCRYKTEVGTGAITRHNEVLEVRFGRNVPLAWESCAHGIIYPGWKQRDGADLALKYVDCDHAAHFEGHLALMGAQTPSQMSVALTQINEGPFDFNMVYAHRDGRIAWEAVGRLPRRHLDGLFVRNAHDPLAQWLGYLPFAENPKIIDPACGFIATANSATDLAQFSRIATLVHCEVAYRQQRIEKLLAASDTHTIASMQAMQADIDSDFARPLQTALCTLLSGYAASTLPLSDALKELQAWNGVFDVNSVGATLFSMLRRLLPRIIFGKMLGPGSVRRFCHGQRAVPRLDRMLLQGDDPLRGVLLEKSGFDIAHWAGLAFERVVRLLTKRYGASVPRWRWGRIQTVRVGSVLAELLPGAAPFVALEAEFPGEPNTLSPAISMVDRGGGLRVVNGASSRFICDLASPREAWFAHSCGPSADPETPYFHSVAEQWLQFRYFRSALWAADEVPDVIERVIVRGTDLRGLVNGRERD